MLHISFHVTLKLVIVSLVMDFVASKLNDSMSPWREAKAQLKSTILSHRAVQGKLCPSPNVNITLRFWPYEVLFVNEVEQSFTTVNYIEVRWLDHDLAWDKSQYHGIEEIAVGYDELTDADLGGHSEHSILFSRFRNRVWHPNIIVTNSADKDLILIKPTSGQLVLFSSGLVILNSPVILTTTCSFDMTHYPFDTQTCDIRFLPFFTDCSFTLGEVSPIPLPDPFQLSGEWNIESRSMKQGTYGDPDFQAPIIIACLKLSRSKLFYVVTVLAPMLLTSMMTSLVFWIPPGSGEKISFLINVFVSNAVFLNYISGTTPRNMTMEKLPRLTLFLIGVMVESFLSLLATLFAIRTYNKEVVDRERGSDNVMFQQVEDMTMTGQDTCGPTNAGEDTCQGSLPTEEHPPKVSRRVENSYADRVRIALGILLFGNNSKVGPFESSPGKSERTRKKINRRYGITSRQWDMIFFVLFHVTSIPYYILLFSLE